MRKQQGFKWDEMELGVCYYPEHWDSELWRSDLQRMKKVGIFTVRIAEFAWNKFEPSDGVFTFEFFDAFMEVAKEEDMKVIIGTPTATPPVWLTEKYPEVLNADINGNKMYHGTRRHYNYNSPIYREYCARITKEMAQHYGQHPNVIGWQLDNEFNCGTSFFYSESDSIAFRPWLEKRYGSLDGLNKAWGTVFWNQTYNSWEEIFVPRKCPDSASNPHQELDYRRFISDSVVEFAQIQTDIIKKYKKPADYICTNGLFKNLDYHKLQDQCLDVLTYDSYPNFAYTFDFYGGDSDLMKDRNWSWNLMDVRSACPHFGIMEQQVGSMGWNTSMESPAPKPGQMFLWVMQSVAHGADFISFFRWRTATFGTEIYWHGILDYDNNDNRKIAEVGRIWDRMQKINKIAAAEYKATFAMIRSYDNVWDADVDKWHGRVDKASEKEIFIASQINHAPMDLYYITDESTVEEITKYPMMILPHGVILTEARANVLKEYVAQGGNLVFGCRTGQKDLDGHCPMTNMPGLLADMTQTKVTEYTFVGPADGKVVMTWDGQQFDTGVFNDLIDVIGDNAKVLATYDDNYYAGRAALVETAYGDGKVFHYGGTFSRELVKTLLTYTKTPVISKDYLDLPESVEVAVREKDGETYLFVLNYMWEAQQISLKQPLIDLDTDATIVGEVTLQAFETKVYQVIKK